MPVNSSLNINKMKKILRWYNTGTICVNIKI
jgi:hypothetical protein